MTKTFVSKNILPLASALIWLVAAVTLIAQQPHSTRIYIAPDDHTDYFWSANDVTYRKAFLETLDYYLDQIAKAKDAPTEFQARWNCDGSLWLWESEHHKSADDFRPLIERVRDGHISVPMTPLALTYGAQPAEAALRGMYYAGRLEQQFVVVALLWRKPMRERPTPTTRTRLLRQRRPPSRRKIFAVNWL